MSRRNRGPAVFRVVDQAARTWLRTAQDSVGLRPALRVEKLGRGIQRTLDSAPYPFRSDEDIACFLEKVTRDFWSNLSPDQVRSRQSDIDLGTGGNHHLMYEYLDVLDQRLLSA